MQEGWAGRFGGGFLSYFSPAWAMAYATLTLLRGHERSQWVLGTAPVSSPNIVANSYFGTTQLHRVYGMSSVATEPIESASAYFNFWNSILQDRTASTHVTPSRFKVLHMYYLNGGLTTIL